MRNGPGKPEERALRKDMLDAGDSKIMRILALVDDVADPTAIQTLLDPLRPRLALLRPTRPLRLSRLLFMPLDPLIVPARDWKAGEPAVPRTALTSVFKAVRAGLGSETSFIDKIMVSLKSDAPRALALAGETLWPRAAEILAVASEPEDWSETGLRPGVWPDLAKSIAAVLRRASQLRRLARDAEIGVVETDTDSVNDILRHNEDEPPVAYAMIVRLILLQAPHATPLLRQIVSSNRNPADKIMMRQAIDREMDRAVTEMENSAEFANEIGRAGLDDATAEIRRMTTLLREVELDTSAVIRRSRLQSIREKLGQACQMRFANGMKDGLVTPLTAALGPVDSAGQNGLESCARDLRRMEIVARKVSDSGSYEQQMKHASDTVRAAAASGTLTLVRQLRLIEILFGPEAAELMYWEGKAPGSGTA